MGSMSQPSQENAGSGTCPLCRRADIKVVRSTGLLRRHGPHNNPCDGHNHAPVPGSLRSVALTVVTSSAAVAAPSLNDTSTDLFSDTSSTPPISHPVIQGPILKRLPKGVRPDACRVLQQLIESVISDMNNREHWIRLFSYAPSCFSRPGRGGKSRNLTTLVKRQIEAFTSRGALGAETNLSRGGPRERLKTGKRCSDDEVSARRASAKLEEGDVRGAIRLLSSQDALAPATQATLSRLLTMHPPSPADRRVAPTTSSVALQATPHTVLEAITSFPNGSAAGPDGLRPQHLKDLLACTGIGRAVDSVGDGVTGDSGQVIHPLLLAITDLINLLLAGDTPTCVRATLFGGSITAISKKGGGIRPIAVGYTWRRLAGKVACSLVSERAAALLSPRQLGFGVKGGAEAAVHACRRYVENMPHGHVFVKIDFTNAFNTVRRDVILEAVAQHLPDLLPYASSSFSEHSVLQFGEFSVLSQEGAQQGDPLGPLYFCLAVHELLSELLSPIVLGYMDDVSLGGDATVVADDFDYLEHNAAKLGLTLNRSKCEIFGLTATAVPIMGAKGIQLREVGPEALVLLRSPIIPGSEVNAVLESKREDLSTLAKRLPLMPAHDSLYLLRNVVTTPRLLYTLRTAPCSQSQELEQYDNLLRSTLAATLNVDLTDRGWRQASLPVRWGGLGVRSAALLAPSAYLASAAGTMNLVQKLLISSRSHRQVLAHCTWHLASRR